MSIARIPEKYWTIEGNIASNEPVWFNEGDVLAAGFYTIKYLNGAFKISAQDGYAVTSGWAVVDAIPGGVVDVFKAPSSGTPGPPSVPSGVHRGIGFDTQEAAENATVTSPPKSFYYNGGSLGVVLYLDDYSTLIPGTSNPTWQLIRYKDSDGSEPSVPSGSTGSVGSEPSAPVEAPCGVTGLLSPEFKNLLDTVPTHPGGFGFIFPLGRYITQEHGVDSVLTGDIELRSNSFDITCIRGVDGDAGRNTFKFTLNDDFVNSLCVEIKGNKGKRGDKGPKGANGRHGTGDGPKGEQGPRGKDAVGVNKFTGIKIEELDEIHDTAVVDLMLDPSSCTLEVVKARMAVPENDEPATRVTAQPIYRDVKFNGTGLDSWEIVSPLDVITDATRSADIDIIKLPAGWNGQVTGAVPVVTMKLSQLVQLIVDYYQGKADEVIAGWDKDIKEYVATKDKEARTILAELAQELTECEWSAPIKFCLDIEPIKCR